MTYYESRRAALVMGVPDPAKLSTSKSSKLGLPLVGSVASLGRSTSEERSQDLAGAIDAYLQRVGRRRSVARSLHEAVAVTQILDVIVGLNVGKMPFLRIPGSQHSSNTPREPKAVWAVGAQMNECSNVSTELILVGSLDGLTGTAYTEDNARVEFSFPSDPGFMTGVLIEVMGLDIERDDYVYEMQWESDPELGEAARSAHEINRRASTTGARGSTWVEQHLPAQRVVASVTDIWTANDNARTVLARPALIQSTI